MIIEQKNLKLKLQSWINKNWIIFGIVNLDIETELLFIQELIPGFQQVEYFKIFILFIFIFIISLLLFSLAYIFSLNTTKDSEKLSQYECGFEPFDDATRHPFDVHFYIVGILFLIFDVEISLLFPWVLALKNIGWFGFFSMFLFVFILGIGFFYEWHRGALLWPHELLQISFKKQKETLADWDKTVIDELKWEISMD